VIDSAILKLIAITDDVRDGEAGLVRRASAAVRGGATSVQLRLKNVAARDLVRLAQELVRALEVPVIVNDRADVAIAAGAAGVHLGPEDVPPSAVRRIAPPGFIIGVSVGDDAELESIASADYAGVGPFYESPSKDDAGNAIGAAGFAKLAKRLRVPAIAIGGITADNAREAIDAGAVGVAAISAILGSPDPAEAARRIRSAIGT
jgi:thiamine-phosphate pyrophosphorylase